jgi:putative aminopeptidase
MRMSLTTRRGAALTALLVLAVGAPLYPTDVTAVLKDIFPVPATTGNEGPLADRVRAHLAAGLAVEEDGLGGIAVRTGPGPAGLLVLAALDGYGHFVSGITPEGYLTLDRPVPPPHAQFDAYLLGQPVLVSTRKGLIQGVVAQPAMHLLNQERRRTLVENFTLENAFVDIAVRSAAEAKAKGVEVLDAVTFWPVLTELAGGKWSGPALGLKATCAALAAAAEPGKDGAADGAVLAWAAQTKSAARGRAPRASLGALRVRNRWQPRRVIILDLVAAEKGPGTPVLGKGPVLVIVREAPSALRDAVERAAGAGPIPLQRLSGPDTPLAAAFAGETDVVSLAMPVQYLHTPSEIVDLRDVQALRDLLAAILKTGGER